MPILFDGGDASHQGPIGLEDILENIPILVYGGNVNLGGSIVIRNFLEFSPIPPDG